MEDFAAFRATHPSMSSAVEACTRPDWLVRLALEALGHKEGLRVALRAARLLTRDTGPMRLLRPWPGPLEALDKYTAYQSLEDLRLFHWSRAAMLSLFPAGILTLIVNQLWHPEHEIVTWLASLAMVLVFAAPFALLFRALLALAVSKQAATLDDDAALERAMTLIERGAAKHPQEVRYVMDVVRREIAQASSRGA